jgi:beta-glucanase (GH16 family)
MKHWITSMTRSSATAIAKITLSDGVLELTAEKKPGASLFDSGLIRSHRTFYYGYYEARVFLPSGKGVWPAFWLEADYDQDGRTWHPPEIDIFEYVINGAEDRPNMLHSNLQDVANTCSRTLRFRQNLLK